MKSVLMLMLLVSCMANKKSDEDPAPSPSPVVEQGKTPEKKASVEEKKAFEALSLVVAQPFETNDWKFDFTKNHTSEDKGDQGLRYFVSEATMIRKNSGLNHVCKFAVEVSLPPKAQPDAWGTIHLIDKGSEIFACGKEHKFNYRVTAECVGYSQDTYVCGKSGIKYDLLEY